MLRRVIREQVVGLSGPRALLMQAAHPVAFAGFFAHTGALDEPYERLAARPGCSTSSPSARAEDARRATRRVRAMHRRVRGELAAPAGRFPAGTPYAADDPALLLWILAALADSAAVVYQRYVRRAERAPSARRCGPTTASSGASSACARRDMPATLGRLPGLHARHGRGRGPARHRRGARARGRRSSCARRSRCACARCSSSPTRSPSACCPPRLRRQYGFAWDPVRAVAVRGGAEYAKRFVVPFLPERLRVVPSARRRGVGRNSITEGRNTRGWAPNVGPTPS